MPRLDPPGPAGQPSVAADLRVPMLAAAGWGGGLASALAGPGLLVAGVLAGVGAAALVAVTARSAARAAPGRRRFLAATVLAAVAVAAVAGLRAERTTSGPVAELARQGAAVEVELQVTSDPRRVTGRYDDLVLVRATVRTVRGRGRTHAVRAPVLLLADEAWLDVPLGSTVLITGLLQEPEGDDLAGVLLPRGSPDVVARPGALWRASGAVRASLRESVEQRPSAQAVLVPALVAGDDAGLDPEVEEDFRTTGLTHLTAVSGTNLTLIVGALLLAARWAGVRGRWLLVVGAAGIVGFVLLARTEPSVVRAAAMGTVALVGMGSNGRQRGLRSLGVAVLVLLLLDPGLATSVGFALSASATAGILLLAPRWRDAMSRWLPRPLAEAVAVPAAAQLACTPLVAGISGQVSLVAVVANLLVAPAVAPATVLGLLGGLVGLGWPGGGRLVGTAASWCVGWIVAVARRGADLPTAAVDWSTTPVALAALTALCVGLAAVAPRVLARRRRAVPVAGLGLALVLVPLPTPGWPGDDWVLAACDVGQGDALVLNAGAGRAVLVDAGPDPVALDRCLDGLAVEEVPLVVLTHFHADHVDGLAGALSGRSVGAVEVSPLPEPADGAADVAAVAAAAGVPVRIAEQGETRRLGRLTWQVLWPPPGGGAAAPGAEGDAANDASVVLWVRVAEVSLLLTGDIEPPAQRRLAAVLAGLRVDVLKVPHHGSRHQDLALLTSLAPRLALTSVGADNGYGHPAAEVLDALEQVGARTVRTDRDGTVLVTVEDGRLGVRTAR